MFLKILNKNGNTVKETIFEGNFTIETEYITGFITIFQDSKKHCFSLDDVIEIIIIDEKQNKEEKYSEQQLMGFSEYLTKTANQIEFKKSTDEFDLEYLEEVFNIIKKNCGHYYSHYFSSIKDFIDITNLTFDNFLDLLISQTFKPENKIENESKNNTFNKIYNIIDQKFSEKFVIPRSEIQKRIASVMDELDIDFTKDYEVTIDFLEDDETETAIIEINKDGYCIFNVNRTWSVF